MIYFIKLSFIPHHCEFVTKVKDPNLIIAVSEKETGNIHLIKSESKGEILKTVKIHGNPITSIKYNEDYDSVISTDNSGMIEYWDPKTLGKLKFFILFYFIFQKFLLMWILNINLVRIYINLFLIKFIQFP